MERICRYCIFSGICNKNGKNPTDSCSNWEWKYAGSWFDN